MTEKERNAMELAWAQVVNEDTMFDHFLEEYEKQLSPKHPPKGAICEVWTGGALHQIRIATGTGRWVTEMCGDGMSGERDHYRVIPTAQDALKAIEASHKEMSQLHEATSIRAMELACEITQDLIDNAQEG